MLQECEHVGRGTWRREKTSRWKDSTRGLWAWCSWLRYSFLPFLNSENLEGLLPIPLQGLKCFPSDSHDEGKWVRHSWRRNRRNHAAWDRTPLGAPPPPPPQPASPCSLAKCACQKPVVAQHCSGWLPPPRKPSDGDGTQFAKNWCGNCLWVFVSFCFHCGETHMTNLPFLCF